VKHKPRCDHWANHINRYRTHTFARSTALSASSIIRRSSLRLFSGRPLPSSAMRLISVTLSQLPPGRCSSARSAFIVPGMLRLLPYEVGSLDLLSACKSERLPVKRKHHRHKERIHIRGSHGCHGEKCLHLFSDSQAYNEQMGPIPSSNISLDIALSDAHP